MALARLGLKQLQRRVISPNFAATSLISDEKQRMAKWDCFTLGEKKGFSDSATEKAYSGNQSSKSGGEVAVLEGGRGGKKSKLFSRKGGKRGLWRDAALYDFFPSGLGNALMEATENINRLLENLGPSRLLPGRLREKDECYKLQYEVPGIAKEGVKVTVEDGVLRIKAEHGEDKEEESDDEHWSSSRYGYYDASVVLPDDAKADEIKAQMKDGILHITVPRTEKQKKDVTEVQID